MANPKVFFIGGVFPENCDKYFEKNYYKRPDVSSLLYGREFLKGLLKVVPSPDITVFAVPQVGGYPVSSKKEWVSFRSDVPFLLPVNYHSLIGLRHASQIRSLKKQLQKKIKTLARGERIKIIVENAYLPYLSAVNSICKNKRFTFDVTVIVPDLPEYVGKSYSKNCILRFAKKRYVARTYKLIDQTDCQLVLFSPAMRDRSVIGKKINFVSCGITSLKKPIECEKKRKKLVFVGKLSSENLVREMIDAFMLIKDPSISFDIVGDGDEMLYAKKAANEDGRIHLWGFLPPAEADAIQIQASAIIALRSPTKASAYSFPSKLVRALVHDVPVVAIDLPCYTDNIRKCLIIPQDPSTKEISKAITIALSDESIDRRERDRFIASINNVHLVERILKH